MGRKTNGRDTNSASDWEALRLPAVSVNYPNGGETWIVGKHYTIEWTAKNPNGRDGGLSVDIYYSADSGKTWATVVKNTENDGKYEWRLPLAIKENGSNYFTVSATARIKVVATDYGRNFMLTGKDMSDGDFCPPVDKSLLTDEELKLLGETDTAGMMIVDSKTARDMEAASTAKSESGEGEEQASAAKNDMLNREEDDFGMDKEDEGDGDGQAGAGGEEDAAESGFNGDSSEDEKGGADGYAESADAGNAAMATDNSLIAPDGDIAIEFNLNS